VLQDLEGESEMRVLLIDDEVRRNIKRVVEFSSKTENYYRIDANGKSQGKAPGLDARHVVRIDTYRCVFSVTSTPISRYRHLSVGIPEEDKYPNPLAAWMIASEFGFTGWDGKSEAPPKDWLFDVHKQENCVVVAQLLSATQEAVNA
jgi:hypothetical protein